MSTVAEQPAVETKPEDLRAFIKARNEGTEIKKPEAAPVPEEKKPAAEPEVRLPRSQRRQLNAAMRDAAEERGRRIALEEMIASGRIAAPGKTEAPAADAEPQRSQFAGGETGTAEYLRAVMKWDKAQEAKDGTKAAEAGTQQEQYAAQLKAMDEKAVADIATIPDWDAVQKAAAEDEDAPEFDPGEHPTFMAMLAQSDVRAFALHHFAKNPDSLETMLELTKDPGKQIRAFHRLEGRLEKEYDGTKAAQAAPEKGKTAETPHKSPDRAEPQQEAKPAKPKPSSEVAARGGSPAPDEPAIGSAAWMLKRNQAQFGH